MPWSSPQLVLCSGMPSGASEMDTNRHRETTLKVATIILVIACLLVFIALLWDGHQAKESKKATLGNRAVAENNTWLACMNYEALHPSAPIEPACQKLPPHTVPPPPLPKAGGNDG